MSTSETDSDRLFESLLQGLRKQTKSDRLPALNKETKQEGVFSSGEGESFPGLLDMVFFRNFGQKMVFSRDEDPQLLLLRPNVNFRLMRISNSRVNSRATDLMLRLLDKKSGGFGSPCFGYFTADPSYKVIPIEHNNPERFEFPLCGLWIYGIKYQAGLFENSKHIKQLIWGLATDFLRNSHFKPRFSVEKNKCSFLFVLFAKGDNPKFFTIEKLEDNRSRTNQLDFARSKINFSTSLVEKNPGKWVTLNYEREVERALDITDKILNRRKPPTLKTETAISISDQASPFCIYNLQNPKNKEPNLMSRSNPEKQGFLFSSTNCQKCLKNASLTSPNHQNMCKSGSGKCFYLKSKKVVSHSTKVKQKFQHAKPDSLNLGDCGSSGTCKEKEFSEREWYLIQNLEKQMELTNRNDKYYKGMIEKMQLQIDMLTKCMFNINSSLSRISDNPSFRDQNESSCFAGLSMFDIESTNNYNKGRFPFLPKSPRTDPSGEFHLLSDLGNAKRDKTEIPPKDVTSRLKTFEDQTIEILDQTGMEIFKYPTNKENENTQNYLSHNLNFKKGLVEFSENKQEASEKEIITRNPPTKLKEIEDMTISLNEDKSENMVPAQEANKTNANSEKEEDQEEVNYLKIIEENRKKTETGQGNSNNFSIQVPKISDKYKHMLNEEFWETPGEE